MEVLEETKFFQAESALLWIVIKVELFWFFKVGDSYGYTESTCDLE